MSTLVVPAWPRWQPKNTQSLDPLGQHLIDFAAEHPNRPLLILSGDLFLRRQDAETLLALAGPSDHPDVLTTLCNAHPNLNAFADLDTDGYEHEQITGLNPQAEGIAALVNLLGAGNVHPLDHWPDHLLFFSPAAIQALAHEEVRKETALHRLHQAGGELLVSDSVFAIAHDTPLNSGPRLEAHEQRRPPPWGDLTARLSAWMQSDSALPEPSPANSQARSLHITHSWGGGVAQWVQSYIAADAGASHFQLRSEGPQNGWGCGQRLSLYLGNQLNAPLASWWLDPPIQSSCARNRQYKEALDFILNRYGIGRIIVSSLVGHSLEGLQTGLPTIQVLHDFYPAWPLLDVHPEPYLAEARENRLDKALEQHELLADFRHQDSAAWMQLADEWRTALNEHKVHLVAPSASVVNMLRRLDPDWESLSPSVIHHGLAPLTIGSPIRPRNRKDGKLRLVIPGRMQEGKGQALLLAALPELTKKAQIYLLGAGKDGEAFFGQSGVNVITQYRREDLPELMRAIGPDLAALLSTVPETFSYMLSELREMEIPVVATRVGSLAERIEDGKNGWLIEPSADELIRKISAIAADPDILDGMRTESSKGKPGRNAPLTAEQMVRLYDELCAARPREINVARRPALVDVQVAAHADFAARLRQDNARLRLQSGELQSEVEKRTQWASDLEKNLEQEQETRQRWVRRLESDIASLTSALDHEKRNLAQAVADFDAVVASSSWRVTRPLRTARRVLDNLARARAWNPLRWPLLISQTVRTVSTLGIRGALLRSQQSQSRSEGPDAVLAGQVDAVGDRSAPETMPCPDEPLVSIVIPVYNKWEYTAACLRSIVKVRSKASFEVIVVDDHSSDESAERLEKIDGLKFIRNPKNVGFVGSCNRGAEAARGQYILLLNNDTQVTDGWLDALLHTFNHFPDTGMAGARLVYPDGRLQEAGGMIFSDGSGWNYGKNDRAEKPEYSFTREVDYCSGACIVLPAELYRRLGGLDERYAPAYYEDTDLAFRVRAAGLKVRVQGAATIVHFEGVTAGTDITTGTKRYQEINRKKFLDRWKSELAAYPAPITEARDGKTVRKARDHHLKGRVLIIDAYTPEPDQDSGSLRLRYLFGCFQQLGYGVTFFADNRGYAGRYTREMQESGVEVLYNPWLDSLQEFFQERGDEFDFVLISRHYVAANYLSLIQKYCLRARFIFDTVDLHYLREQRLAELEDSLPLRRVAAQTRRSELAVIRQAAATLVVSEVEREVLNKDAPDAVVHVLSNIHTVRASTKGFSDRKDILFVGGYQHPPNIDAAQWFVSSIWPLIRQQLPDITFHLIGSKAPDKVRALHGNGVEFHGFVDHLEPWLDGCRLSVAPLRYGAGVKGKVNLSMAHGQPVVATPMAVEGLYASDGTDVLVAETAGEFAAAVVRLYRDEELWNRLSNSGKKNVEQHFSVERARQNLAGVLDSLTGP
ncbi:MAG TPA: glycosyltransferase [Xanthomonadales bacterium]|nr:glycosyltransferase [Xanthomonadales bacterium]